MAEQPEDLSRRDALGWILRGMGLAAAGGMIGAMAAMGRGVDSEKVWQIDPWKCIQCGKCATDCVLNPSAVRCLNQFPMCGYCKLCTGYFVPESNAEHEGAENQLCPTDALKRVWVEDQYYEYYVQADLCIGCARCVKGCLELGNGSLFLQIDQKLCVKCNQCSIATVCPSKAITRISAKKPYILVDKTRSG